ncbi:MAG: hypothetical protein R3E89_04970 [Thiolinea sp.]
MVCALAGYPGVPHARSRGNKTLLLPRWMLPFWILLIIRTLS